MSNQDFKEFDFGMFEGNDVLQAAVEAQLINEGASAEHPVVDERKCKGLLRKLTLEVNLKKDFLSNPSAWTGKDKNGKDTENFYTVFQGMVEIDSAEVRSLLGRDSNPQFRLSSNFKGAGMFPNGVKVVERTTPDAAGQAKPLGLDLHDIGLVGLLGAIFSTVGWADRQAGANVYNFSPELLSGINNGIHELASSLIERAKAGEAISEDANKNHPKFIPYLLAQKQVENISELIAQLDDEAKTFGVVLGRRAQYNNATKQENYIKDFAHISTDSGKKLLEEVIA